MDDSTVLIENGNIRDLNELYTTILKNAFEWDEEVQEVFIGVFSLISFSKSQLSDETINYTLGIDTAPDLLMYPQSRTVYEPGNLISIPIASFYGYLVSCQRIPWYLDAEVKKAYCFQMLRMDGILTQMRHSF